MNYGTRFGSDVVSSKMTPESGNSYAVRMARHDAIKMASINANLPLHRKELAHYKGAQATRATVKRKTGKVKDERLEAERRMLEALRKCVSILEFHSEELHRTRKVGTEKGLVNQYGIHNALVLLRTKCGVRFEPNEYDHHIDLAQLHLANPSAHEQSMEFAKAEMEQQRLARLRNMKMMAERFITRHRGKPS